MRRDRLIAQRQQGLAAKQMRRPGLFIATHVSEIIVRVL